MLHKHYLFINAFVWSRKTIYTAFSVVCWDSLWKINSYSPVQIKFNLYIFLIRGRNFRDFIILEATMQFITFLSYANTSFQLNILTYSSMLLLVIGIFVWRYCFLKNNLLYWQNYIQDGQALNATLKCRIKKSNYKEQTILNNFFIMFLYFNKEISFEKLKCSYKMIFGKYVGIPLSSEPQRISFET